MLQVEASADEATARAERREAEADEQAAKARSESVEAEREGEHAAQEILAARTRHDRAREIDPDTPDSAEREAADLDAQRANGGGDGEATPAGAEMPDGSPAGGARG